MVSLEEIVVLTLDGDIVVYNSQGQEISALRNLLQKKLMDEGWRIRGLEICPEQDFLSVVSCRPFTNKQGVVEKEYDKFYFIKIEKAGLTGSI